MNETDVKQNGWQEAKLGEVTELVIDYRGKTPKKLGGDWGAEGYRAISARSIKDGKLVNEEKMNILPSDLYSKWMKDEVQLEDIIITSEAPLGEHLIWKSNEKIVLSQRVFGIRTKKELLDPFYFNYFIDSSFYQHELRSRQSGTTVTGIRQSELLKTIVLLPPLPEQKAIAEVLSSLDDKIDLLHRQNKTLEDTAQALFRKWFVEEADEGWETKPLDDYVDCINGVSYKSSELESSDVALVTLKSFDRGGGFKMDGFKEFSGKYKDKQVVEEGDLVVAHTDITQNAEVIGNPALVISEPKFEKLVISMDLVKVKAKDSKVLSTEFLYCLMKTREFKHYCLGNSNGSTVLHLSKSAIPTFVFKLPPPEQIYKFTCNVNPVFNKKFSNISQIRILENLRDTLLPKLMNGAVRVKI